MPGYFSFILDTVLNYCQGRSVEAICIHYNLLKFSQEVGRTYLNSELPSLDTALESLRTLELRAGETAQLGKCLQSKRENLSSGPRVHIQPRHGGAHL